MEIKIIDYPNIEGAKDIIINGSRFILSKESLNDYKYLGHSILMQYNKQMPLEESKYDIIKDMLNEYLGIKHYKDGISIETSLSNSGNVIKLLVLRRINVQLAGGFIKEATPDSIIQNIGSILSEMIKLKELTSDEFRYIKKI